MNSIQVPFTTLKDDFENNESFLSFQQQRSPKSKFSDSINTTEPYIFDSTNNFIYTLADTLHQNGLQERATSPLKRNPRAKRAVINRSHLAILEAKFQLDPKPSQQIRSEIAQILNLPERSILVWFQNRRTKARANGEMEAVNSTPKNYCGLWPLTIPTESSAMIPLSPYMEQTTYLNEPYFGINFNQTPSSVSTPLSAYSEYDPEMQYSQSYINPSISSHFDNTHYSSQDTKQFLIPSTNFDISSHYSFVSPPDSIYFK